MKAAMLSYLSLCCCFADEVNASIPSFEMEAQANMDAVCVLQAYKLQTVSAEMNF